MREIKFRGIDTESGKWIYGGYVLLKSGVNCILSGKVTHMPLPDSPPHASTYEELNVLQFHAVKYKTIGEYTGLKDTSGKEIFEGDIVKVGNIIGQVKYCEDRFLVCYGDVGKCSMTVGYTLEVIGNIHENGKLIPHSP